MISQIDLFLKPQLPKIQICKPDKTIISNLTEAHDIVLKQKIIGTNELSFNVLYNIEKDHELIANPNISLLKNRYLLKFTLGVINNYQKYRQMCTEVYKCI